MNVLVLGGNGFIGSHLVDKLRQNKHTVHVFDQQHEHYRQPLPDVHYHLGDFGNRGMLADVLRGIDVVFHLISTTVPKTSNSDPAFDVSSNVIETIFLLEQCVKENVKKVIFASSGGAVYGKPLALPVVEDSPTAPESSYGITKLTIEKYMRLFHQLYGLEYGIVRPSNPYGPRQNLFAQQGVIAVFMGKIIRGDPIEIWGDGEALKDYIYISDLIDGMYKAAFQPASARIFNLGSGAGHSLNEIIHILRQVTGKPLNVAYSAPKAHDVAQIYLDVTRAKEQLAWQPSTTLDIGIEKMWRFVKEHAV
jgi:UDP-glucose 4-epimerase